MYTHVYELVQANWKGKIDKAINTPRAFSIEHQWVVAQKLDRSLAVQCNDTPPLRRYLNFKRWIDQITILCVCVCVVHINMKYISMGSVCNNYYFVYIRRGSVESLRRRRCRQTPNEASFVYAVRATFQWGDRALCQWDTRPILLCVIRF